MSKFTIYTDKQNDFRWKFTASNDRVLARSSEGYVRKEDCLSALGLVQKDIPGGTVEPDVQSAELHKASLAKTAVPAAAPGFVARPAMAAAAPAPAAAAAPAAVASPVVVTTK